MDPGCVQRVKHGRKDRKKINESERRETGIALLYESRFRKAGTQGSQLNA